MPHRPSSTRDDAGTWAGVRVLRWPDDASARDDLAGSGRARLLVVDHDADPPLVVDPLEDWMWASGDATELAIRLETLAQRSTSGRPLLDDDGVLHLGREWVVLAPHERAVARLLVERFGTVVPRPDLLRAGWGDQPARQAALNLVAHRIRQRVAPLGLSVTSLRLRGLVLHRANEVGEPPVPGAGGALRDRPPRLSGT